MPQYSARALFEHLYDSANGLMVLVVMKQLMPHQGEMHLQML